MQEIVSQQLWQQELNGLAEEFLQAISKKFFRLRVQKNDPAHRIDNHDCLRRGNQHRPGHSFAKCGSSLEHISFPELLRRPEI
jgi:hypothetical protein